MWHAKPSICQWISYVGIWQIFLDSIRQRIPDDGNGRVPPDEVGILGEVEIAHEVEIAGEVGIADKVGIAGEVGIAPDDGNGRAQFVPADGVGIGCLVHRH